MTRRASVLDAIEPDPVALVHPLDLALLGGQPGDLITLASRCNLRALLLRRSGYQQAKQCCIGSICQNSRVQILRDQGHDGWLGTCDQQLRRWADSESLGMNCWNSIQVHAY
jgi:hypothetical protein